MEPRRLSPEEAKRVLDQHRKAQRKPPSTFKKIKNFGKALISHVMTGMKQSPESLILERYAICKACPLYTLMDTKPKGLKNVAEVGYCADCGCTIHKEHIFPNKLAWPEQKCPQKKWGPV